MKIQIWQINIEREFNPRRQKYRPGVTRAVTTGDHPGPDARQTVASDNDNTVLGLWT